MNEITVSINPNDVKVRDPFMLMIINGATKANTHVDHKKENNKKRCRAKVDHNYED